MDVSNMLEDDSFLSTILTNKGMEELKAIRSKHTAAYKSLLKEVTDTIAKEISLLNIPSEKVKWKVENVVIAVFPFLLSENMYTVFYKDDPDGAKKFISDLVRDAVKPKILPPLVEEI